MAARKKSGGNRYSEAAGKTVASAMRRKKHGTLRSGRGGKGGIVTSRKQAIATQPLRGSQKGGQGPEEEGRIAFDLVGSSG